MFSDPACNQLRAPGDLRESSDTLLIDIIIGLIVFSIAAMFLQEWEVVAGALGFGKLF